MSRNQVMLSRTKIRADQAPFSSGARSTGPENPVKPPDSYPGKNNLNFSPVCKNTRGNDDHGWMITASGQGPILNAVSLHPVERNAAGTRIWGSFFREHLANNIRVGRDFGCRAGRNMKKITGPVLLQCLQHTSPGTGPRRARCRLASAARHCRQWSRPRTGNIRSPHRSGSGRQTSREDLQ